MGGDGTVAAVSFDLSRSDAKDVRTLWLEIHGLEYEDMASVRLNDGPWISLSNRTAGVQEPGKSYGGIGGGFATLKLTLPLAERSAREGANLLAFRFNHSNGISSGFRVLALNLLDADGRRALPSGMFTEDDPQAWTAPLSDRRNILDGEQWWRTAQLRSSDRRDARPIRAHCGDCHAEDGRDLKYFNYSNHAIIVRSQFHGLTERQGEEIASYIRSLPFASPGRPWNPPYQPGPGLGARPATEWAAGAGLESAVELDSETLQYLFPAHGGAAITQKTFAPDGDIDERAIPIAMQLPDWNHWLPQVHPVDAWGEHFTDSQFARLYRREQQAKADDDFRSFFAEWLRSRRRVLTVPRAGAKEWSPAMTQALYSALLWQLVKAWQITQRFSLEAGGAQKRSWPSTIPAATAPATINIPDDGNGMNGSALTNEYFNNAWYELQILLNSGDHRHYGREPVDWVYVAGHVRELERWSGRPEPGRLLVLAVRAMQSTDPRAGPQNLAEGWRPELTIDPRLMVAPGWSVMFAGLPLEQRREITQAWLAAWLDRSAGYPVAEYFYRGQVPGSYAPPRELHAISGGRVWEAAPLFRGAGVDAALVRRLETWGAAYTTAAELFHY